MSNQSLDDNEMINVRWASEDPNPSVKEERRRKVEQIAKQTIEAKMELRPLEGEVREYTGMIEQGGREDEGERQIKRIKMAGEKKENEEEEEEEVTSTHGTTLQQVPKVESGFVDVQTLMNIRMMVAAVPGLRLTVGGHAAITQVSEGSGGIGRKGLLVDYDSDDGETVKT